MKNVLIIICDQLSARALKIYGNQETRTPSIDRLAEKGVVFENAYSNCPLCQPSRASFWSSSYPHENGVISNLPQQKVKDFPLNITTLGDLFTKNGYECVHFGKEHDYGALRGFNKINNEPKKVKREYVEIPYDYETYFDVDTIAKAKEYFEKKIPVLDKPFLTVVDLQNPHNICSYIGMHAKGEANYIDEKKLPKLPENFVDLDVEKRASFFQYLCCGHRRQSQTVNWKENDFRHYLYAYYHYLEKVDQQIGQILEALHQSGKEKETLILFWADHGEGMAAHKIVTKSGTFYEETVHVPFIISGETLSENQKSMRYHKLMSLIDILPTLSEYAGLKIPVSASGKSHWQALKDLKHTAKEEIKDEYVVSQWHDEFDGYFVPARMYRDQDYKYIAYQDKNGLEEELYDMKNDILEQKNLSHLEKYQVVLDEYRKKLHEYCSQFKDPFYHLEANYDDKYRRHPLGSHNGPNAVLDYQARIGK